MSSGSSSKHFETPIDSPIPLELSTVIVIVPKSSLPCSSAYATAFFNSSKVMLNFFGIMPSHNKSAHAEPAGIRLAMICLINYWYSKKAHPDFSSAGQVALVLLYPSLTTRANCYSATSIIHPTATRTVPKKLGNMPVIISHPQFKSSHVSTTGYNKVSPPEAKDYRSFSCR